MRVLHCCLASFYIDQRAYQENQLIRMHVSMGHDVLVLASTETQDNSGKTVYTNPREYLGDEGARVVRLPYYPFGSWGLQHKLRSYSGVYQRVESFAPDVIVFHGIATWELLTVARYKKRHPEVKLYADTHADKHNSGRGLVSLELLHKGYYRQIIRRALPRIDKVLCISHECWAFARDVYGIDEGRLEFLPLGGIPLAQEELAARRRSVRGAFGIEESDVLFVQSGKFNKGKKLIESLQAFAKINDPSFRLLVAGILDDEVGPEAERLFAADHRVKFVGWKSREELDDLLCAADVYLQPGSQSVTMQASLCAGCAVIIADYPSHKPFFVGNGWLLDGSMSLERALREVSQSKAQLAEMGRRSSALAFDLLDYAKQAQRLLH